MPQDTKDASNGRIGVTSKDEPKPGAERELLLEEDSPKNGDIDVGNCCNDSNGMPEFKDDQIQSNDEEVCLDLGEPSPEVMEYARRELGETDDVKCRTLQELRDMIYGNYYR